MRTTIVLSTVVILACSAGDPSKPNTAQTSSAELTSALGHVKTQQYDFSIIDAPGAKNTVVQGINDKGDVSGFTQDEWSFFTPAQPVLLRHDHWSVLDVGDVYAQTSSINNMGQIAAGYYESSDYIWHPGVFDTRSSSWTKLPDIQSAYYVGADGINDDGLVVGWTTDQNVSHLHGWLWDGEKYTMFADAPGTNGDCWGSEPTGINNRGDVAGYFTDDNCISHGFLLRGSVYTQIDPTGDDCGSLANGMSDNAVAGVWSDCAVNHGFVWRDGMSTQFDIPASWGMLVTATINNSGVISGTFAGVDGYAHGFRAVPHHGSN